MAKTLAFLLAVVLLMGATYAMLQRRAEVPGGVTVSSVAPGPTLVATPNPEATATGGPGGTGSTGSTDTSGQPVLAVLGDSIAGGSAQGGKGPKGWPALVGQRLGMRVVNLAKSGTGYTVGNAGGDGPYLSRVDALVAAHPDIVVIEGSRNDRKDAETSTAAKAVLKRVNDELPGVPVLVIGPIYGDAVSPGTTKVNDSVRGAATLYDMPFIDTVKLGWFTGAKNKLIGKDKINPTDAGHVYLADLIEPLVAKLVPSDKETVAATPPPR